MRVVLRRAGRALSRQAVAIGDLAPLHPRASEAQAGVAPHRRSVRAKPRLGFGEFVNRLIDPSGRPVDKAGRVHGPGRFPRIADAGRVAHGRLGRGLRVKVVARMRQEVGELALHPRDHQVARPAFRRGEERVLRASRTLQRARNLVLRGEHGGVAEIELGEHQRVGGGVLLGELRELRRLVATHEVVGELEKVNGHARFEKRVLDLGQDLVELRPREVERFEVFEAARA